MSLIIFIIFSISFFIYSLKYFKNSLLILIFIFPFSMFVKIGSKSIMLTEFLILLFCLSYFIRNSFATHNNAFNINKRLIPLYLFLIFTFLISLIHLDAFKLSIYLLRITLFTVLLNIVCFLFIDNNLKRKSLFILSYGYILYSFFLFLEFILNHSGIISNGNLFWKSSLQKFYLYPPSVSFEQLLSWSSVSGLSGFYVLHHTLAIYLGLIFILSIFVFPLYKVNYSKYISITSLFFLLFTNSRTAIISLTISCIIYLFLFYKLKQKYLIPFFIFLTLLSIYIIVNPSSFVRLTNIIEALNYFSLNYANLSVDTIKSLSYDGSTLMRLFYDLNSITLISDNIFLGVGVLDNDTASQYKPHSTLLIQLQMFGIVPVIFLIYFVYRLFILRKTRLLMKEFILLFLFFLILASIGTNIISDLRNLFPIIICIALILKNFPKRTFTRF